MPPEIRTFFNLYRDAFNRLDGDAVARLYAVPSGIVSAGGHTHWASFEPIAANMAALCKLYADQGFAATDYVPHAFIAQGSDFAIADLRWTVRRTGGREPWGFHTTYNLVRTGGGWRILLCTAYEERTLGD